MPSMIFSLLPWELLVAFATVVSLSSQSVAPTSVNVALEASFHAPPYLLELLETAAQENSSSYFPLLDRIAEGRFADYTTEEELYNAFLDTLRADGHISDAELLSSFQLALSLHSAAPRIEAHYHYYNSSVESLLMVAQDAACPVWVHFDGKQYCSPTLERAQQDYQGPANQKDLPFDRVFSLGPELPVSTLYVDINSPLFAHFHQTLSETAKTGRSSYRIRYRPSTAPSDKALAISGYGVELALKRTDYIVIDDREDGKGDVLSKEGGAKDDVSLDSDELSDLKPLSSSELLGLGLKAGSYIMDSANPLETLEKLSQDFPRHSSAISKLDISAEFLGEHNHNRAQWLTAGQSSVWMNGLQIDARQMDAFTLLDRLRSERKLIGSLKALGLSASESISLLSHSVIAQSRQNEEVLRYDYRDTADGGDTIIWLNDIEKDKRYRDWPNHASALLQPTYPGQLPQVRRDIHNAIMPLDLTDIADLEEVVETLSALVQRKIPVRFGIVPSVITPEAEKQAKVVYYLKDKYGLSTVLAYLQACLEDRKTPQFSEARFKAIIDGRELRKNRESLSIPSILEGEEFQARAGVTKAYLQRMGADGLSPPAFINGVAIPRNDAWLQSMSGRIGLDLQIIQKALFEGVIEENAWIAGRFLEGASARRNALIVPEDESMEKILDIGKITTEHADSFKELPQIPSSVDALKQFWSHTIVIVDLDSDTGSKLLSEAIAFRTAQPESNIAILHNPSPDALVNTRSAMIFEMTSGSTDVTLEAVQSALSSENAASQEPNEMAETFWSRMQPLIASLGFTPGQSGVILNGRSIGPISQNMTFNSEDFAQLLNYERSKRIVPVNTALADLGLEDAMESPFAFARITSLLAAAAGSGPSEGMYGAPAIPRTDMFKSWKFDHTAISKGDIEKASIRFVAAIDPTSEVAQRWIPILRVLSELDGVHLKLFLNPREMMQELPVKRFYRYVLSSKPSFAEDGSLENPRALFEGLPKEALLNLAMDVPPAWLVAPKVSIQDLDNIKLSALKTGQDVNAVYELAHILIEGHSRDVTTGQAPRGVQLLLGTEKDEHFADTLIMANVGYFQFKANPGYWNIRLKPGRSEEIFNIDTIGVSGYAGGDGDDGNEVALLSFKGLTLFPRLSRKPGQETEDVLEDGPKAGSASEYAAKASKAASGFLSNLGIGKRSEQADINIFSVASGHLYERMLNIMMVSVMKNTKKTVKFWFIEQFLSPSFKLSIPDLAVAYNFEYEMVTYKWPHWLRGQKEKQREIWGYKILFLDVLFPLSLDKVIFVDADQIVRTDMYELVTHDLQGAPYGFTPMCDSRTEMEGFRFWKQGYWKNYLRGLPYHISALYVVDLKKFRQIAAGDRLRQQYHQLSADPNSLSNLDQDLPNHMQMSLPIHSLPQEWLWCETWCSDESLKQAKTIDLCNNPETKEPKLDRARRQVPEWTVYDDEIAAVFESKKAAGFVASEGSVQEELDFQAGSKVKEIKDEL